MFCTTNIVVIRVKISTGNFLFNAQLSGSLTQSGNNLNGTISVSNALGKGEGIATGQIDGKKVSFSVTIRGIQMSFDGTVSNDNKSLSGSYTSSFDNGSWELSQ